MTIVNAAARPPIHMIDTEADALADLGMRAHARQSDVSRLLMAEIERARIHTAEDIPPDVVTMRSTVEFVDQATSTRRTVELVYPAEADIAANRISVITPVGAGLIGLREGDSILWPDRDGHERTLSVVKVIQPARDTTAKSR